MTPVADLVLLVGLFFIAAGVVGVSRAQWVAGDPGRDPGAHRSAHRVLSCHCRLLIRELKWICRLMYLGRQCERPPVDLTMCHRGARVRYNAPGGR